MNLYQDIHSPKKTLANESFLEELALNIYHKFLLTHPQFIKTYTIRDKQILLKHMNLSLRNLLENFEENLELYSLRKLTQTNSHDWLNPKYKDNRTIQDEAKLQSALKAKAEIA